MTHPFQSRLWGSSALDLIEAMLKYPIPARRLGDWTEHGSMCVDVGKLLRTGIFQDASSLGGVLGGVLGILGRDFSKGLSIKSSSSISVLSTDLRSTK